jgi:glucose/arabinose dehydrogenase
MEATTSSSVRIVKRGWIIALTTVALLATGCGSKKAAPPPSTTTSAAPTTTTPIGAPPLVKLTSIAKLESPTAMAQRNDDNAFYVTERPGRVRVVRDGVVGSTPVLDLSSEVATDVERGMLGIAFAPNSRLFYVDYTDKTGTIHVTEFSLDADDIADMHSRRDLLTIPHSRANHNGGQLAFGPDNNLYIGVGDGGGENDPDKNGQNLTVLLGKILRINPTANGALPYTIPYDNPFVKQAGARGEIWAYGLRNPWRFSFDKTEQGIWIGDVGQNKWEEVDHTPRDLKGGENYGWSLREGTHAFTGDKPLAAIDPVYEYEHANGSCSITGGYVYRGSAIDGMQGRYLFGDYCSGALSTLTQKGTKWNADPLRFSESAAATYPNLVSFGQDKAGELYVLSGNGDLSRLDAA